jgi:sterol desaturase/sphingolipid hydroxylase (fatty acid hydroxylase superfamily)
MEGEVSIRLGSFVGILGVMSVWERIAPRRRLAASRLVRWPNNLAVTFLGAALVRLIFPLTATAWAAYCSGRGWGLWGALPGIHPLVAGIASVVLLDLLIYAQHVAFHIVPPFWRLHRMHHADLDIDVTTGARFHPVEIALSMALKFAAIAAMGAPAWSVLAFEVVLNGTAMFNHSNVRMPLALDRVLRLAVVTPDMHRVHHSVVIAETNSNYGFNLPWWDRLFGTYRAQPAAGHEGMTIGLASYRDPRLLGLGRMLLIPLNEAER